MDLSTNVNTKHFQPGVSPFLVTDIFLTTSISIKLDHVYFIFPHCLPLNCILTCFSCFPRCHRVTKKKNHNTKKKLEIPFCVSQPLKDAQREAAANFDHFQEKLTGELEAGESGIVLKPLNARLSTCIFKNEQKNKNKKSEKNKTVWGNSRWMFPLNKLWIYLKKKKEISKQEGHCVHSEAICLVKGECCCWCHL